MRLPACGLYAITQMGQKSPDALVADVAAAIRGGAVVVQYRDKNPNRDLAERLLAICHQQQVPLIINDDVGLAVDIGADGVHLGRDDAGVAYARERLGPLAIIGVSCYDDVGRALSAQRQGASYVAFGRFFPSSSKPLASPASMASLRQAKQVLNIPIVAIGGILPENGGALLAAGADFLAVIGGLFDGPPESAARAYQALFG